MSLPIAERALQDRPAGGAAATRLGFLAPLTTRAFNPFMRLLAGRVAGIGLLTHIGRVTGRHHRSPVLVLKRGDRYVIGLWYGSDRHWVRNVLAAGTCEMRLRGRDVGRLAPELIHDPRLALLPLPLRAAGRLVRLAEVMELHAVQAGGISGGGG